MHAKPPETLYAESGMAIVRGILSSLSLRNRRKTPREVFSSPRAAFVFLAQHGAASRSPTLRIDELIAAYARACAGKSPWGRRAR